MKNPLIRSLKRQMRSVEKQIARIVLTFGEEPEDTQVAQHLDKLATEWTELRFAVAATRAHVRGEQAEI